MAKTKISALTTLADGSIAIGDLIPIVDIDDTSQAASGTTKKVTITSLASAVATAFSGDSPTFVNLTTTGTTTLGDSGDATTVNGTLGVTGATTLTGNVGIGTAPAAHLHIESNANSSQKIFIKNTTSGTAAITGISLYNDSGVTGAFNAYSSAYTTSGPNVANGVTLAGNAHLGLDAFGSSGYVAVYTGASELERMRITSSGLVGIGTTTPNETKLRVAVDYAKTDTTVREIFSVSSNESSEPFALIFNLVGHATTIADRSIRMQTSERNVANGGFISLQAATGNVVIGSTTNDVTNKLQVSGTAGLSSGTAWTNTSDKRIKQNITSIKNGLEKINQLNPVEFNYIQEYLDEHKELKDIRYNSFIADEYAEVFPNAVNAGGNLEKIITKAVQEVKNEQGEIITAKVDEVKEIIHEKLLNFTPHDLVMYLVASVKELSAKVTALEAK